MLSSYFPETQKESELKAYGSSYLISLFIPQVESVKNLTGRHMPSIQPFRAPSKSAGP